ncbi:hypothetical protein HOF56_01155 [Candidatus Peribacteria bacterium]|jgi:steroid 5-alpha reductase family enzyme|nr:hypothetical protein [Candidatus Peribacteria bacterium]MBT4020921.1 hypothetical protein [Candidatus Peribacteria bacterium]MBT4240479.1 hypothetical protein [Candidatus Peribacteria bacterium]MBT4474363.1 hypothetical protein [Candidatus Peribacteria bacterium]
MIEYWLYPNPGNADYTNLKALAVLSICLVLIVGSFAISRWRKDMDNSVTKKLTKGWSGKMRLFAFAGIFLVICRVEEIQFFAMRSLLLVWGIALTLYVVFQAWWFRKKNYKIVKKKKISDPRDAYLPGKKK